MNNLKSEYLLTFMKIIILPVPKSNKNKRFSALKGSDPFFTLTHKRGQTPFVL
jgi:hypothetical protein